MGGHPRGWSRPFIWAEGAGSVLNCPRAALGHVGPGLSELSWGPAERPAPLLRPHHASSKVQRLPVTSRPQAVWLTAPPYPVPVYFVFLLPGTPDCSHPFLPSAVLRCTVRVASAPTLSEEHPHSPCCRRRVPSVSPVAGRRGFCRLHYCGPWPSKPGAEWAPVPADDALPPWLACRPTARPLPCTPQPGLLPLQMLS